MGETDLMQHALKNNGHRCYCNTPLTFEVQFATGYYSCKCERCEKRALSDGHVIAVRGYGTDPDLAFIDWTKAQERF